MWVDVQDISNQSINQIDPNQAKNFPFSSPNIYALSRVESSVFPILPFFLYAASHNSPCSSSCFLCLFPHNQPINPPMLFQKQKHRNRMRSQSDETRHPTSKHPPHSILREQMFDSSHNPMSRFPRMRTHNSRLDDICRRTHRRSNETRSQRRKEVRGQIIL